MLCILYACNHKSDKLIINSQKSKISNFHKKSNVEFREFNSANLIKPLNFHFYQDNLILSELGKEAIFLFHEFDINTGDSLSSFVKFGGGPSEVLSPISTGLINDDLYIYDLTTQKIVSLALDQNKNINNEYTLNDFYMWVTFESDSTILGVGNRKSFAKIERLNFKNKSLGKEVAFHTHIPDQYSTEFLQDICQTLLVTDPSGENYSLLYRYIDAVEIFKSNRKNSVLIQGPYFNELSYEKAYTGEMFVMLHTEETTENFIYAYATEKYIYGLYSGGKAIERESQTSNTIFVYDWEGNPVNEIILSRKILSFGITPLDDKIFSYDLDKGEIIYADLF